MNDCMLSLMQLDLALELQRALEFLWKAERYELMVDVGKLLLPFYEEWRDYEVRGYVLLQGITIMLLCFPQVNVSHV